jgi:hypothetical protein
MRIAAALPGPGQYHIKRNPEQPGGRFNLSKAKTDVEWKMYRASKIPGPGEYPVHTMDPRTIGGARIQGGRFDESRPKNDIEWRAYNASGRVNPEGQPGPGQYDTFNPPKMLDPAGGRFNLAKPKSELDFILDRAKELPGPGEYDAPRWPCPNDGRFGKSVGVKMDRYRKSPFPKQHIPRGDGYEGRLVTKVDTFGHMAGASVSMSGASGPATTSFQMVGQPDVSFSVPASIKRSKGPMLSEVGFGVFKGIFEYLDREKTKVMDLFHTIDADGSGTLDAWEFQTALKEMGVSLSQADTITAMKEIDFDFDGTIDVAEFLARVREEQKRFREMDVDNDGDVTLEEYNAAVKDASISASSHSGQKPVFRTMRGMAVTAQAQIAERDKMRADLANCEHKLPPTAQRSSSALEDSMSAEDSVSGANADGSYERRLALARPSLNPNLHPVDWGAPQANESNNVRFMRAVQEAGEEFAKEEDYRNRLMYRGIEAHRRLDLQERRDDARVRTEQRRAERVDMEESVSTSFVRQRRSYSTLPVPSDLTRSASVASLTSTTVRHAPDTSTSGNWALPTKLLAGETHAKPAAARRRKAREHAKLVDAGQLADLEQFERCGRHLQEYSVSGGLWPEDIKRNGAVLGRRSRSVELAAAPVM